jgi:hypothetical protein
MGGGADSEPAAGDFKLDASSTGPNTAWTRSSSVRTSRDRTCRRSSSRRTGKSRRMAGHWKTKNLKRRIKMRFHRAAFYSAALLLLPILVVVLSLSSFFLADDSTKLSHKLSLRLSGGLGFVTVGDMNTSFKEWALTLPSRTTTDTELRVMKIDCWSMTWEAELRFDLSRQIALGLALSNPFR